MSLKSPIFERFLQSHTNLPRVVEYALQVPPGKKFSPQPPHNNNKSCRTTPRCWKGVGRDGNYYRLPIPPSSQQQYKTKLPVIPKLPKSTPMPMALTSPPKPPETVAQIQGFRLQLSQWVLDNLPVMVLNVGSLCTLIAFTRTDVMELRSLAMTGQICFVGYQLKQRIILWPSVLWSTLFATVNAYNIHKIWEERHSVVRMTDVQERIFVNYFMPHGVTPKQFERLYQRAYCFKLSKGRVLLRKGDKLDHVYLIIEGSTQAHILGRRLTAASTNDETRGDQKEGGDSGVWVGEIAFLKQFWEKEQQGHVSPSIGTKEDRDGSAGVVVAVVNGKNKVDNNNNDNSKHNNNNDNDLTTKMGQSRKSSKPWKGDTLETAFYTVLAAEDCTVLRWSHDDLEELMESSVDLRSALTRAMSIALVGKVVNLTISRAHHGKVPWLEWLVERRGRDGSTVEVQEEDLKLAEDRG